MVIFNDSTGRLMIWRLRLMERNFEIVYQPGLFRQVPGALFKFFIPDEEEDEEFDEDISALEYEPLSIETHLAQSLV